MGRESLASTDGGEGILRFSVSALAGIFLLSGCSQPDASLPYPVQVSGEGVGPLHPGTTFDVNTIRPKLPGFDVEVLSRISPDAKGGLLLVKRHGTSICTIEADAKGENIVRIDVLSPLVKDGYHQGIGDVLSDSTPVECVSDTCHDRRSPALEYRIDPNSRVIREIVVRKL